MREDVVLECDQRIRRVVADRAFQAGAGGESLFRFDTCEEDKNTVVFRSALSPQISLSPHILSSSHQDPHYNTLIPHKNPLTPD